MVLTQVAEIAIIVIVLLVFSAYSFRKKLLNKNGIIFADIVGLLIYFRGGSIAFLVLVVFYITAILATLMSIKGDQKHEKRTSSNILANSAAAIVALFLGQFIAFFGAISAALADTVSSEIGMMSKKKPILITNFKQVEHGTDGGITLLGTSAGIIAAILIAIIYYLTVSPSFTTAIIIAIAGMFGSIIDSLLGAIFERKGQLNNFQVNLIASSSGAIIAYGLTLII